jgi:RNA polymerase sigma-70 factor (ECF subfamily)
MKTKTKLIIGTVTTASLIALAALAQSAGQYSVRSSRPVVVKTVPAAGATDVDPNLKEITVTFSKDMMDRNWSVCQTTPPENFPEDPPSGAKMHYMPDKRTCVMPVKLQPGRTYVLWFNRGNYMAFKDTAGKSSWPYELVFETKQ